MTDDESTKIWACISAGYPAAMARMGDAQARASSAVYRRMLADLDYPTVNAAVEGLIATSKFLPTVAEIREAAASLTAGPVRAGGEAWGDVLMAVRRFGINRRPEFADPLTAAAVHALGWRELCNSENQTADRARFIELYDQIAHRRRHEYIAAGLPAARQLRELRGPTTVGALLAGAMGRLGDGGEA